MGHALGKTAVIGEQQESGRRHIEPTYGEERAHGDGQELHDRWSTARIGPGRQVAGRLVQQNVPAGTIGSHSNSVHPNIVFARIHLGAHSSHDLAADSHPPVGDQLLGLAAGGEP